MNAQAVHLNPGVRTKTVALFYPPDEKALFISPKTGYLSSFSNRSDKTAAQPYGLLYVIPDLCRIFGLAYGRFGHTGFIRQQPLPEGSPIGRTSTAAKQCKPSCLALQEAANRKASPDIRRSGGLPSQPLANIDRLGNVSLLTFGQKRAQAFLKSRTTRSVYSPFFLSLCKRTAHMGCPFCLCAGETQGVRSQPVPLIPPPPTA